MIGSLALTLRSVIAIDDAITCLTIASIAVMVLLATGISLFRCIGDALP